MGPRAVIQPERVKPVLYESDVYVGFSTYVPPFVEESLTLLSGEPKDKARNQHNLARVQKKPREP